MRQGVDLEEPRTALPRPTVVPSASSSRPEEAWGFGRCHVCEERVRSLAEFEKEEASAHRDLCLALEATRVAHEAAERDEEEIVKLRREIESLSDQSSRQEQAKTWKAAYSEAKEAAAVARRHAADVEADAQDAENVVQEFRNHLQKALEELEDSRAACEATQARIAAEAGGASLDTGSVGSASNLRQREEILLTELAEWRRREAMGQQVLGRLEELQHDAEEELNIRRGVPPLWPERPLLSSMPDEEGLTAQEVPALQPLDQSLGISTETGEDLGASEPVLRSPRRRPPTSVLWSAFKSHGPGEEGPGPVSGLPLQANGPQVQVGSRFQRGRQAAKKLPTRPTQQSSKSPIGSYAGLSAEMQKQRLRSGSQERYLQLQAKASQLKAVRKELEQLYVQTGGRGGGMRGRASCSALHF